jgi:hypothetical protein
VGAASAPQAFEPASAICHENRREQTGVASARKLIVAAVAFFCFDSVP